MFPKIRLVLLFVVVVVVVTVIAVIHSLYSYVVFFPLLNSLTVITRRRAAVIKISVAVPSNISRITNACIIIDTINAATFKKYAK